MATKSKPKTKTKTKTKTRKAPARKTAKKKPAATAAKKPPAKKKPRLRMMFRKVAFTMFSVEDPMRARAFYEHVLGLERGLASPDGAWTEYDLPAGGCLALFRHPDPAVTHRTGGASIALEVADLDALNERLTSAGVTYQGGMIHGPNCRMSSILDSEGNGIILHQLDA